MMYGYGYGPMMGYGSGGWVFGLLMMAFWLLVLVGFIALIVWAVRHAGSGTRNQPPAPPAPKAPERDEACEIARTRFAKGEITQEEFEAICKTLGV